MALSTRKAATLGFCVAQSWQEVPWSQSRREGYKRHRVDGPDNEKVTGQQGLAFLASGTGFGSEKPGRFRVVFAHPLTYLEEAMRRILVAVVDHPGEDFSVLDNEYASAMEKAYNQFGEEVLDVVTLYADALIHTALRKMLHEQSGLPIKDSPFHQVLHVFDRSLQHEDAKNHPGTLHLSIHFLERSATPAAALSAADKLRNLVPDAGHMHHMPTHLDVLAGDYGRSIDSNKAAVRADDKYLAREGAENFYSFYRLHIYHSLMYAGRAIESGHGGSK
ncbi:hypothetical protein IFM46972_01360 [Aspergillus udagawae]|uniref:Uncharacterized protein n=1 Tax=Aspergillus udagawae TaxID=91492 RepID=A0A8H3RIC7_9EURO|nr:hypothetical protein IFM46972_01360 [Aspergillus udagawae]